MRTQLLKILGITLLVAGLVMMLVPRVGAADGGSVADHVVISEIQTDSTSETGGTGDDWIELYNPTANEIDLTDWHLGRDSNGGNSLTDEMEITDGTIPKSGFFLVVSDSAKTELKDLADAEWSGLTFNDKDVLYLANANITDSNPQDDEDVIDILGLKGCEPSTDAEGSPAPNPAGGESIQRKVSETVNEDGTHGPAWDTDDNSADFFIQSDPNHQSSGSSPEPPLPELPTITLFSLGLLALGAYLWFKRRPKFRRCDS